VTDFAGRFCKEADRDIVRHLRARGLVFKEGTVRHDYPFCWRASDEPLIQYARPAWFIRTTERIDDAIANNQQVFWLPEHIKDGRFGDFLANNVDWALSRERYWGTPLPIWECAECGALEALDKLDRALERNPACLAGWAAACAKDPDLPEHLVVHKPWVDKVTFPCAGCGGTMRRVPEVIDCWFDSGCMPFAQWGFPHQGVEQFREAFPADFISEAIDQTRGWFYSMLMVSTLIFDEETQRRFGITPPRGYPHPYRACIVLGHVGDADGKKESKSAGNYTPPDLVLEGSFTLRAAPEGRLPEPPPPDAVVLLPAQVKTLGLPEGVRVRVHNARQPERAFEARLLPGQAGKESIVLGSTVRATLGVEPDQPVLIDVLDDPPGADAFRWFFFASGPTWSSSRNSLRAIREQQNEFLVRWSNVLSFFLIYAAIDGFDPADELPADEGRVPDVRRGKGHRPAGERPQMDRWILSETALTGRRVTEALDGYRVYDAATALREFVDALSNWYVRRCRDRFWAPGFSQDKRDAFWTLWEVLVDLALMSAPFVPFFAEHTWRTLVGATWPGAQPDSIHLAPWPELPGSWIDEPLSRSMSLAREVVSLGLSARANQRLRVRQPLAAARIFLADHAEDTALTALAPIVADELNVKQVVVGGEAEAYVIWKMQPNFRLIGPRVGALVPGVKKALGAADAAALRRQLDAEGVIRIAVDGHEVTLGPEEVAISLTAREHYAASSSARAVVVLETDLDEELLAEGLAREVVNRIQGLRKEQDFDYADRIEVTIDASGALAAAIEAHHELIAGETLAAALTVGAPRPGASVKETDVEGQTVRIGVTRIA
jgi:isoleucyl-tRNA synthetase